MFWRLFLCELLIKVDILELTMYNNGDDGANPVYCNPALDF